LNLSSSIFITEENSVVIKRRTGSSIEDTQLPEPIRFDVSNKQRRAACSATTIPEAAIIRVDLNGDHISDYVIEYDSIPCNNTSLAQALQECGTGGCSVDIWLSRNSSWQLVVSDVLRGIEKGKPHEGRDTLLIATHGVSCNQVGYKSCFYQTWWNGQKFDRERIRGRNCAAGEQSWECESSEP
jgi:hypothetical protein